MSDYHVGSAARVSIAFADASGSPGDPSQVALTVKDPSGVTATYTLGGSGAVTIVRDTVGGYHADVTLDQAGTWHYAWQGDTPEASDEGVLNVLQPGTSATRPLVVDLRRMVAAGTSEYTIGGETFWTDDQLQAVLENHVSSRLVQAEIPLAASFDANGSLRFLEGRVQGNGTLDTSSVTIVRFDGRPITGSFTVQRDGRITFTDDQIADLPVASALWYDLHAAAAEVLFAWASAVKLGYDVTTDGQQMNRSQRHEQLLKTAESYRARALPKTFQLGHHRGRGRQRGGSIAQALMTVWPYLGQRGGTTGG